VEWWQSSTLRPSAPGTGIRLLEETNAVFPAAAGVLEEDAKKALRPISFVSSGIEEAPPSSANPTTCCCRAHPTTSRAPRGGVASAAARARGREGGREGGREAAASADLGGGQGSAAAPLPAAVGRGRTSPAGAPTRAGEDEPHVAPPPPGSAGPRASIRRGLHILLRRSRGRSRGARRPAPRRRPRRSSIRGAGDAAPTEERGCAPPRPPRPPRSEVAPLQARRGARSRPSRPAEERGRAPPRPPRSSSPSPPRSSSPSSPRTSTPAAGLGSSVEASTPAGTGSVARRRLLSTCAGAGAVEQRGEKGGGAGLRGGGVGGNWGEIEGQG
jgi:hypothetical protein